MAGKSILNGKLMTIRATAKNLDFPEDALRQMAKEGRVPGTFLGNRFYVNVERLKKQLEEALEKGL